MICIYCSRSVYTMFTSHKTRHGETIEKKTYQCPFACSDYGLEFAVTNGELSYIHMTKQLKDKLFFVNMWLDSNTTNIGYYNSGGATIVIKLDCIPDLHPGNIEQKLPLYLVFS